MAKCGRCRRLTWAHVQLSAFTVHNVTNPSVVLSHEVYVTAALVGATAFVALSGFGLGRESALGAGLFVGLVVRGMALRRGWSLPRYRERPGRTLDELDRPD